MKQTSRTAIRSGFTLMEMLVVVAILVVLAGAAVPLYLNYLENARLDRAQVDVKTLEKAVDAYQVRFRTYPTSLRELIVRQPDGSKAPLPETAIMDPWNQEYVLDVNTMHPERGVPRIYSLGPPGANQPIANW